MADAAREFDIVVYGASGFVGRLVAEYLACAAPAGTRIALAGRSAERLRRVRAELPAAAHDWPVVEADSTDSAALAALAASTRVLATTVGPYMRHGLPVVAACAAAGTHYADLTGEIVFVRRAIDEFDALARTTGARIVHSCGYDSIPSDLATLLLHERAAADGAGALRDVRLEATMSGGMSGGTIASILGQVEAMRSDPALRRLAADPFALSPDRDAEPTVASPPTPSRPGAPRTGGGPRRSSWPRTTPGSCGAATRCRAGPTAVPCATAR
ncbi:saccharopine dehydrogenase NADP-binding domain-containing protein [Pseudonocardia humida]|uniref:saccharopine dehydrogenase NADP-binding domain-containing protein n=1 Tax=Pseudonocardia humida TaxID=2800819 RepID=UPI00207D66D8|nr:saccharopine dehydrogenase NADP-binding domain-containing protein [Pseudonocardia humida]